MIEDFKIDKCNWALVKFGDVVKEPKENCKDAEAEGVERVVGLEHIDPENIHLTRFDSIEESTTFTKKFAPGDVLFGRRRAYLKKAAQATFEGICSGDITVFRVKDDQLLPELLPFIVQNEKFFDYAIEHSAGGLSPRVKFKDLANYEFLLPPKEQQPELAELLWSMDEVIEKELAVKENIEALLCSHQTDLKRTYYDKSIPPPSDTKVTEGRIDSFFVLQRGFDLTKKNAIEGDFPVISSSGVSYYHNEAKCDSVGVITGRKGKLGDVFYVDEPHWPHDTSLWVKDFKGNDPKFVYWFLKSINLEDFNAATAVPTLNRNVVHPLLVRFPDENNQVKIREKLDLIQLKTQDVWSHLNASKSLQKSLINQVF